MHVQGWRVPLSVNLAVVAQVSKPAVSPTSKSAALPKEKTLELSNTPPVWKPAIQQTGKSALRHASGSWPRCVIERSSELPLNLVGRRGSAAYLHCLNARQERHRDSPQYPLV